MSTVLVVRLQASAVDTTSQLVFEEALQDPAAFVQHVQALAQTLLRGAAQVVVAYVDDDGDECTLTQHTALDALSFAVLDSDGFRTLMLRTREDGKRCTDAHSATAACVGTTVSSFLGDVVDVLTVKVHSSQGDRESQFVLADVLRSPANFVEALEGLASEIHPEVSATIRTTYMDEEGDACTLTAETVSDALSFSRSCSDIESAKLLELGVKIQPIQVARTFRRQRPTGDDQCQTALEPPDVEAQLSEDISRSSNDMMADLGVRWDALITAGEHTSQTASDESLLAGDRGDVHAKLAEATRRLAEAEEQAKKFRESAFRCQAELEETMTSNSALRVQLEEATFVQESVARQLEHAPQYRAQEETDRADQVVDTTIMMQTIKSLELELTGLSTHNAAANDRAIAAERCQSLLQEELAQMRAANDAQESRQIEEGRSQHESTQHELTKLQASCETLQSELRAEMERCTIYSLDNGRLKAQAEDALSELAKIRATEAEEVVAAAKIGDRLSAKVLTSTPFVLGVEASEDEEARGDCSLELCDLASKFGSRNVFRIGRVCLDIDGCSADEPACTNVTIMNDGRDPWPATTVVALLDGDSLGLPVAPLGRIEAGETAEIIMDLCLPPRAAGESSVTRSVWCIIDAVTAEPFGPILVFESVCRPE